MSTVKNPSLSSYSKTSVQEVLITLVKRYALLGSKPKGHLVKDRVG